MRLWSVYVGPMCGVCALQEVFEAWSGNYSIILFVCFAAPCLDNLPFFAGLHGLTASQCLEGLGFNSSWKLGTGLVGCQKEIM